MDLHNNKAPFQEKSAAMSLTEFMTIFEKLPFKILSREISSIYGTNLDGHLCCPITLVASYKTKTYFKLDQVKQAADALNLEEYTTILNAIEGTDRHSELRKVLCYMTGAKNTELLT